MKFLLQNHPNKLVFVSVASLRLSPYVAQFYEEF